MSRRKVLEGRVVSMRVRRVARGERFHSALAAVWKEALRACRTLDKLAGRWLRVSQRGRESWGLLSPRAARFASASARSLPSRLR